MMRFLIFLEERIRPREMMRNSPLGPHDFNYALARVRRDLSAHGEHIIARANEGFGQIRWIVNKRGPGQPFSMADEVFGDYGAVAARHSIAADPAFFQVRGSNH